MKTLFKPEHLKRWQLPSSYCGAHWDDYFCSGCGRSRDSKPLERANFDAMLKALGGEKFSETETVLQERLFSRDDEPTPLPLVYIVKENHWAVGWVEWIAIHETATEQLQIADKIAGALEDYAVIDETLWSEYETDEANEVWRDCYDVKERIKYIRENRSQFEFHDFADMLGCIRGNYFAGYASDLIS